MSIVIYKIINADKNKRCYEYEYDERKSVWEAQDILHQWEN